MTDADSETVPTKPPRLDKLMVDVLAEPWEIVRVVGLVEIEKSGTAPVVNVAPSTVSGSGVGVPLARVTQTPPETLVFEQPVWNPSGVPAVAAVTL